MNKYLRSVGFTKPPRRKDVYDIIKNGLQAPAYRAYTINEDDEESMLAQFDIELGREFGLTVCGQFNEGDEFFPEYYYPYLDSETISSTEELTVEPRVDNDSYAGICDDIKVGAALIFRLRNSVEYLKNLHTSFLPMENTSVTLTALSLEGRVMLPIYKSPDDLRVKKATEYKRRRLLNAARIGDESAMRDLAGEEMNLYSSLLALLPGENILSLVESYFMPCGAECELYSVMGEILHSEMRTNRVTGTSIWILRMECNGLPLTVAIHEDDLMGDPQPGCRFKGVIWLQGKINFPIQSEFPEIRVRTGDETGM